jgi:hypothetical protein
MNIQKKKFNIMNKSVYIANNMTLMNKLFLQSKNLVYKTNK